MLLKSWKRNLQFSSPAEHFQVENKFIILKVNSDAEVTCVFGRNIAEAGSRLLPTAAARVRARVWQVGFVVDKMVPGQLFSEYFGFPCQPYFIPPTSPFSQSPGTGTIGQHMAAVPREHSVWTPPPTIRIKKKKFKSVFNLHLFLKYATPAATVPNNFFPLFT
jgi:hypothetical protein